MRGLAFFTLLAVVGSSFRAAWAASPDPMCAPLRSFVSSVKPGETRELTFHTLWGSNFKNEPEAAIYAKLCVYNSYGPAEPICAYLMEHGSIEFSDNNVKRALSCLSARTTFGPLIELTRGAFSLRVGTSQRGRNVTFEFTEDSQLGGMAFHVSAEGY